MIAGARYGHTNLIAEDWRGLSRFYQDIFGCVPVPPERDFKGPELERGTGIPGSELRGEHLRLPGHGPDGPTLEIFNYNILEQKPEVAVNRPGFGHIAFVVDDVAAARDAVLAAGGRAVGDVVTLTNALGKKLTWVYVTDPEGNVVELQSRLPPEVAADNAAKPNPALQSLKPLVGTWNTLGTHPLLPGKTFHGRVSITSLDGGGFLLMRFEIDEPEIPNAIAVFGTDDASGECSMLYFDERGVSRRYETRVRGNEWHWWRNAPGFSQRFVGTIADDGRTIAARGEYSRDEQHWEPDLALTYERVD